MKIEEIVKKHKTITNITKHLSGKKVKVITPEGGSYSSHGLEEGTTITILRCNGSLNSPYFGTYTVNTPIGQRSIYGCEFKLNGDTLDSINEEINDLEKNILKDKAEIELLKTKINFMKKNDLKEFDETDFTVYAVLEQLENPKLTKVERAQAIAKLVKG